MQHAETASSLLRAHGVKPSLQRVGVLAHLLAQRSHPTVESIYRDLLPGMPTLSKTTVYNTLGVLLDAGLVRVVHIEDNETRYDAELAEHGHFKCERCGRIYDFDVDMASLARSVPEGFRVAARNVYLHGLCRACQNGSDLPLSNTVETRRGREP